MIPSMRQILLFALLLATVSIQAESLQGKVVAIADGDTFTLLDASNTQVKVRLAEIDTPEKGAPYANRAKQALSGMVFQKQVAVVVLDTDRYGRTVGRVYVGDLDVNAELVRVGAAWVYRKYLRDESLLHLEAEARQRKVGIWSLPEAQQVPPWEWRKGKRPAQSVTDPNCQIKGNINSKGDRIYHVPGSSSYSQTRLNESKGERWFCSEAEAIEAGWRAPRN
jgi:endonuclease YncB( thermonuclease family)